MPTRTEHIFYLDDGLGLSLVETWIDDSLVHYSLMYEGTILTQNINEIREWMQSCVDMISANEKKVENPQG